MSLINDMLRDLDARRPPPVNNNIAARHGANMHGTGHSPGRGIPVWVFAGFCILCAIAVSAPLFADFISGTGTGLSSPVAATPAEQVAVARSTPGAGIVPGDTAHPEPAHDAIVVARTDRVDEPATEPASEPTQVTESHTTAATRSTGIIRHAITDEARSQHAYRQATRAAAAGRDTQAITLLEELLAQTPDHHDARVLLASLLIRRQQHARAGSILARALDNYPQHAATARLLARLLISQGSYDEAIMRLETALPGAANDAGYQALLAGLYQRRGRPDDAVRHYTIALDMKPGRGEWWMGLGISQEQAGNTNAAAAAYRKALRHPLAATLQEFINDRLQQMPSDGSAAKSTG